MNKKEEKCRSMLLDRCTPEKIEFLKDNEVFVFGVTPDGIYTSLAAKLAVQKYGAIEGKSEGLAGQSYAIPVHRYRVEKMQQAVKHFISFAQKHSEKRFLVLPIGCGAAKMDSMVVALMFVDAIMVENIFLPRVFIENTIKYYSESICSIDSSTKSLGDVNSSVLGIGISPKGYIAIARDFALVLNDVGHLTLIGNNSNFKQLKTKKKIIKIAAAFCGYMGLTEEGCVVTNGNTTEFDRSCEIERWKNVKDIVASEGHTVVILQNGSVDCIDESGGWDGVPHFAKTVASWKNIKQVAVGFYNIMALTEYGRVLYHSVDTFDDVHIYDKYSDIIQIDAYSHYYGDTYSIVLHKNGTVNTDVPNEVTSSWTNIVQVAVGADIIIGLRSDGIVEIVAKDRIKKIVSLWRNVVAVECNFFEVVGILKDGSIVSTYEE